MSKNKHDIKDRKPNKAPFASSTVGEPMDGVTEQDAPVMPLEQRMKQEQLQRSMEASKQMLYGVYGNVITMLEEFEERELKAAQKEQHPDRSNIKLPDQSHKKDYDIKAILEAQLVVFHSQLNACPEDVRNLLRHDLKKKLLLWNAQRNERKIEIGDTDKYAAQVFALIASVGSIEVVDSTERKSEVTAEVMRDTFQAILYGEHDRQQLDQSFKDNPGKQAESPDVRAGDSIRQGVDRLLAVNPDLEIYTKEFLPQDLR